MQQGKTTILRGGLDLVTPRLAVDAGRAIAGSNYECDAGGYRRFIGYERTDGRAKPSDAQYWILAFDAGSAAISAGDTVTGATSGESGVALVDAVVESGSYGGGDAAGYLVLHSVGTTGFQDNENLQVSAVTKSVANGTEALNGAETDALNTTYLAAEIARRRALITTVPGSGAIRGVAYYAGSIWAIRDNAGGTAGVLHKSSAAGWVAQTFGEEISFASGTAEFTEGDTLTGGTSGATATIERIVHENGAWGTTASGRLILSGVSGGPFNSSETITGALGGSATTTSANAAITLPPAGRYLFETHNFFGAALSPRLYMVNGVGRAHEWDGSILVPIHTGLSAALDKPTTIAELSNHLFLGYNTGLVNFSSIGEPTIFDTTRGAGSFSFGSELTNLKSSTDTVLSVTGRLRTGYISGKDATDFQLLTLNDEAGAEPYTAQRMTDTIYIDTLGVRKISAADTTGGFRTGTMSQDVEPLFRQSRAAGKTIRATMRVRGRDIYRVFYSDGSGLSMYVGRSRPEFMPFVLDHVINCTDTGIAADGSEIVLGGTDDGYVMEFDKGFSFDGEAVEHQIRFPFDNLRSSQTLKRFTKAVIELESAGETSLYVAAEYSWGTPDLPSTDELFSIRGGSGGFWDSAIWEQFYWDTQVQGVAEARLQGIGTNCSIAISGEGDAEQPHTFASLTLHFSPRRMVR